MVVGVAAAVFSADDSSLIGHGIPGGALRQHTAMLWHQSARPMTATAFVFSHSDSPPPALVERLYTEVTAAGELSAKAAALSAKSQKTAKKLPQMLQKAADDLRRVNEFGTFSTDGSTASEPKRRQDQKPAPPMPVPPWEVPQFSPAKHAALLADEAAAEARAAVEAVARAKKASGKAAKLVTNSSSLADCLVPGAAENPWTLGRLQQALQPPKPIRTPWLGAAGPAAGLQCREVCS
eukprot:gnl/TRDRNA2_/TRDRNA2_90084_c0_seq1.p1 gnl/TRDRNA2_/TRDRNA2_90084_c0~~gnl/TRDRNA2_/TRDRNA2_90084_c0_seq1.p1  ORF type:complete len:237 (-),score=51.74 gnl/TRDRNA2_/TRDRNA2_90084_c0_seq1:54-764(-)